VQLPDAVAQARQQRRQLIPELDAGRPAARRRAAAELEALDDRAAAALRQARQSAASPEALRGLRAVELLQRIGTADARRLLAELATGAAAARLTVEARAARVQLEAASRSKESGHSSPDVQA
jgi:hypothetical protein